MSSGSTPLLGTVSFNLYFMFNPFFIKLNKKQISYSSNKSLFSWVIQLILVISVLISFLLINFLSNNEENFDNLVTNYQFTSNMVQTEDLDWGYFRLLTTDKNILAPYGYWIRILVTSADVLHSWTIPSLGVKIDACPGRLNQTSLFVKREGVYYGQCSEICGVNHAFMPIVMEVVDIFSFNKWSSIPNVDFNFKWNGFSK